MDGNIVVILFNNQYFLSLLPWISGLVFSRVLPIMSFFNFFFLFLFVSLSLMQIKDLKLLITYFIDDIGTCSFLSRSSLENFKIWLSLLLIVKFVTTTGVCVVLASYNGHGRER